MRTLTLKRPATAAEAPAAPASAGQPAPITPELRRAVILSRIEKLRGFEPKNTRLSFAEILEIGEDMQKLRRMARSKASLGTVLRVGARVAAAYGVDMATIDPCHGIAS